MNENRDALTELAVQIKRIAKSLIEKAHFDKTYTGIISAVNKSGYTVKYNGTDINIKTADTDVFKKYDMVKFCIPQNMKNKVYFLVDLDLMKRYVDERITELRLQLQDTEAS